MRKYERRRSNEGKDNRGCKRGVYVCVISTRCLHKQRKMKKILQSKNTLSTLTALRDRVGLRLVWSLGLGSSQGKELLWE